MLIVEVSKNLPITLSEDLLYLIPGKWRRGRERRRWRKGGDSTTFRSGMPQLISNLHCREQMAQLRPIYKTTGVRGHFSVGSLLPPLSSSRKIRLFIFKNILNPLLKKNCWQVRKKTECLLVFKKSLCSHIEQRAGKEETSF